MNTMEKIVKAQKQIINNLAECEQAISELYAVYSEAIPDHKDFWKDLSKKEQFHASLLITMQNQLDQGKIFQNIGRFDAASIEAFLKKIRDAIEYARENDVSPILGIETALAIESSILDTHFYDVVRSNAPEYNIVAQRLSADTNDHVKIVQDKLLEIQSNNSMQATPNSTP